MTMIDFILIMERNNCDNGVIKKIEWFFTVLIVV